MNKGQNKKKSYIKYICTAQNVFLGYLIHLWSKYSFVWSRRLYIYWVFSIFFPLVLLISNPPFLWLIVPSTHQETIAAFKPLSIKCYHMEGWGYWRMLAITHYKSKHKWHLVIKVLILLVWLMSMKTETLYDQSMSVKMPYLDQWSKSFKD